jgi:hypothetical protein
MKIVYFFIFCVILYYLYSNSNTVESFNSWPMWPIWNLYSHNRPYSYDIRGEPNIVYKKINDDFVQYGYIYGPHIYDTQGNYVKNPNNVYYIR